MHDPVAYPQPYEFRPDRFIGKDGTLDRTVRDPLEFVFGFGRRCELLRTTLGLRLTGSRRSGRLGYAPAVTLPSLRSRLR